MDTAGQGFRLSGEQRLYQIVARRIARMIEANAKDPNWRMPSERELAEELEVSRPVVREAVIALEMRGIVEVRGRTGMVVLPSRVKQVNFDGIGNDAGPGPFELLEARWRWRRAPRQWPPSAPPTIDIMVLEECIAQMQRKPM